MYELWFMETPLSLRGLRGFFSLEHNAFAKSLSCEDKVDLVKTSQTSQSRGSPFPDMNHSDWAGRRAIYGRTSTVVDNLQYLSMGFTSELLRGILNLLLQLFLLDSLHNCDYIFLNNFEAKFDPFAMATSLPFQRWGYRLGSLGNRPDWWGCTPEKWDCIGAM